MQTGKIYFIHLRETNEQTGELAQKGGATVAWMVEEETGNLVIGQPARCRSDENFIKSEGRDTAMDNLLSQDPLEVYTRDEVTAVAAAGGIPALNFSTLTPSARVVLMSKLLELLQLSPSDTMSTQWYESFIRSRIELVKGRLKFNFEQGDFIDFIAIQKADQTLSNLVTTTLHSLGAIIEA
jgi:hypothetical protein